MKLRLEYAILVWIALFFPISLLNAADNKNYSGCEVCHGGIHYGPDEAKEILGKECFDLLAQLTDQSKTIKIDLDGVLKNGSREKPDAGYEIMVWGAAPFFIKDLRDESTILISNRMENSSQGSAFDRWKPEIYLYASKSDEIGLKDSMDTAWGKMKTSAIYYWVVSNDENMAWNDLLKSRMLKALELMTRQ